MQSVVEKINNIKFSLLVILLVAIALAIPGMSYKIGGGEMLNIQSGIIASTPQDENFSPLSGYLDHLLLFRHALWTPRVLYQTLLFDIFGPIALPFHIVALIFSLGTAIAIYFFARYLKVRNWLALWSAVVSLVSTELAHRWYMVEPGTTHNSVIFFAVPATLLYLIYREKKKTLLLFFLIPCMFLAAISYPSGMMACLGPLIYEFAFMTTRKFSEDSRKKFLKSLPVCMVFVLIAIAVFAFHAGTTSTFQSTNEGGSIIGAEYGKGFLAGLLAWVGSFWVIFPSYILVFFSWLLFLIPGSPDTSTVMIVTAVIGLILVYRVIKYLAKRSAWDPAQTGHSAFIYFTLIYSLGIWMLFASSYLYVFKGPNPPGPQYILSAFLLNWGQPLSDGGDPYYLVVSPYIFLCVALILNNALDYQQKGRNLSNPSGKNLKWISIVVIAFSIGSLVLKTFATVNIITRPQVKQNSGRPFTIHLKSIYPEFPRGSTLLVYDPFGFFVPEYVWVTYAKSRRSDRIKEYQKLDLPNVLRENISWYEERFVGRQMSPYIMELYTNLKRLEHIQVPKMRDKLDVPGLPLPDWIKNDINKGQLKPEKLFAVFIQDFNTVRDISSEIRSHLEKVS